MKKLFYFIFLLPLCAFGASNGSGEYDIVPRTINFLIFVAILLFKVCFKLCIEFSNSTSSVFSLFLTLRL